VILLLTKVDILVEQDLYPETQLAVAARALGVADLRHLGNTLVKGKPEGILVEGAVLARTQRDHSVFLVPEHGVQLRDHLSEPGLAVNADFTSHCAALFTSSSL